MKKLLLIALLVLAAVVWFGPVRSIKVRHYCNYQASQYADKVNNLYAYQPAYTVCVRGQ